MWEIYDKSIPIIMQNRLCNLLNINVAAKGAKSFNERAQTTERFGPNYATKGALSFGDLTQTVTRL